MAKHYYWIKPVADRCHFLARRADNQTLQTSNTKLRITCAEKSPLIQRRSPMPFMREIYCAHCEHPTRHHVATLGEMFGHQTVSSAEWQKLAYACPECNHLGLAT